MSLKTHSFSSGLISLTTAKLYFFLSGFLIYIVLTRFLGPEYFGIYSITISLVSVINMVLISGTVQSVSKYISEEKADAESVKKAAVVAQCFFGGSVFLVYFLLAEKIAALLNDVTLSPYIRLSSWIILFYSFYAIFIGYFNGLRKFVMQASMDITFSTIKFISILIFLMLGFSVNGAIVGFVMAAGLILVIALLFARLSDLRYHFKITKIISFGFMIMLLTLIVNLLMNIDLFLLKSLSSQKISNLYSGYYAAGLTIARIPYQAIIPLSLVIFPIISQITSLEQTEITKMYITRILRYSLLTLVAFASVISINAQQLIVMLYSNKFAMASQPLSVVAFAMMFFSLFVIMTTVISASGRPKNSVFLGMIILLLDIILNLLLIPRFSMLGAAWASTISMTIGFVICLSYIKFKFHITVSTTSFIKIATATIIAYSICYLLPLKGLISLVKIPFFLCIFFAILLILREFNKEEINKFIDFFKNSKFILFLGRK